MNNQSFLTNTQHLSLPQGTLARPTYIASHSILTRVDHPSSWRLFPLSYIFHPPLFIPFGGTLNTRDKIPLILCNTLPYPFFVASLLSSIRNPRWPPYTSQHQHTSLLLFAVGQGEKEKRNSATWKKVPPPRGVCCSTVVVVVVVEAPPLLLTRWPYAETSRTSHVGPKDRPRGLAYMCVRSKVDDDDDCGDIARTKPATI